MKMEQKCTLSVKVENNLLLRTWKPRNYLAFVVVKNIEETVFGYSAIFDQVISIRFLRRIRIHKEYKEDMKVVDGFCLLRLTINSRGTSNQETCHSQHLVEQP